MIHQTRPPIFFHWSMLQLTLMWPFLCVFDQGISNVPLTDQQLHCPKSTSCAALFVLTPLNHSQQFVLRLLFGGIRADGLALAPHMHLWALGANDPGHRFTRIPGLSFRGSLLVCINCCIPDTPHKTCRFGDALTHSTSHHNPYNPHWSLL